MNSLKTYEYGCFIEGGTYYVKDAKIVPGEFVELPKSHQDMIRGLIIGVHQDTKHDYTTVTVLWTRLPANKPAVDNYMGV